MKKINYDHCNRLLRFIFLCFICGVIVGIVIFIFKFTASVVIELSCSIYAYNRENLLYAPLLVAFMTLLGVGASLILRFAPDGKGGGIPTAISVLRGLVSFSWIKSLFAMFTSAMLTFLSGVPLGNEGPSVQMGTSVGRGCCKLLAKDQQVWDRYIMTGGACAGFAAATGTPLSGILFSFEEAHRRFSPMIFAASAVTAVTASSVMKLLCTVSGTSYSVFSFHTIEALPMKYSWVACFVGVVCGVLAIILTKFYRMVRELLHERLSSIPFMFKLAVIFSVTAVLGLISENFISSGHDIVETLVEKQGIGFMLVIYLLVRALMLLFSNNAGVTGGLFVPTLALGAISGGIVGNIVVSLNLLPPEHYSVTVIIGIAGVLASFSRTPIMAIAFSLEALGAVNNMLPVIIAVTIAFVLVEHFEVLPFTDVVIEAIADDAHKRKKATFVDIDLVVAEHSFIVDKEMRDILWPPSCVVTSIHKDHKLGSLISAGDILSVHFKSYDVDETLKELEAIVGVQRVKHTSIPLHSDADDEVPEL